MRRSLDRGEPGGVELLQGCPSAGSPRQQSWTPGNHDDDDSAQCPRCQLGIALNRARSD